MKPQNIADQLTDLKNKAKIHASNSRGYNMYERRDASDEMKAEVQDMNSYLTEMYARMDDILSDKYKTEFSTNQWLDGMLDNRRFTEPNPPPAGAVLQTVPCSTREGVRKKAGPEKIQNRLSSCFSCCLIISFP